jgi:hypothetical protein
MHKTSIEKENSQDIITKEKESMFRTHLYSFMVSSPIKYPTVVIIIVVNIMLKEN